MAETTAEARQARHPIRVVSERTGLSPDLLRAWESRYQVVTPQRSEGGHRLYSDADVERLRLLHQATLAGRSIGQVAGLSTEGLAELAAEDAEARAGIPGADRSALPEVRGEAFVSEALEAVRRLDQEALDRALRKGALTLGTVPYLQEVAAPFLRTVGELWHGGALRPAHEHLASVGVRRVLDWLISSGGRRPDRPRIVIGTPAGEYHEMGALLAAAGAEAIGWEAIYLGPNLPADEIAQTAIWTGARAVALSAVYAPEPRALESEIRDLRSRLAPSVTLLVGGGAAGGISEALQKHRIVPVGTIPELVRVLRGLEPPFRA